VAVSNPQSRQVRDLQRAVRVRIEASSVNAVALHLGVSREALARFLAGLPVHAGTVLLIKSGLECPEQARA
jgi:hypothetical protein